MKRNFVFSKPTAKNETKLMTDFLRTHFLKIENMSYVRYGFFKLNDYRKIAKNKLRRLIAFPRKFIQKGRKGYNYESLWALDEYLADMLSNAFVEMAEIAHGHPADMTFVDWLEVLQTIAEGFKNYDPDDPYTYAGTRQSLVLMANHYQSFWD